MRPYDSYFFVGIQEAKLRYCCAPLPSLVTGTYDCLGGAGAGSLTTVVVALAIKVLREHLPLVTGTYACLAGLVLAALPR